MKRISLFLLLVLGFYNSLTYAQVKIGNNPSEIHANSILELESSDKVLVISRVSNTQMIAIKPLRGALVYNTDEECVFMYSGTNWKSLCGGSSKGATSTTSATPPITKNIGDFWINTSNDNETSIWDGNNWVTISNNPIKGNGPPSITTAPNPKKGSIYVNKKTGSIYAYDGTTWVVSGANVKANNGVFLNADNTLQLGGAIIKPTIIETNANNTFGIKGLQEGDITKNDLVAVNRDTGEFTKITSYNLFREEVAILKAKKDGAKQFSPPLPISDSKKVNVYRNGVRIDFIVVDNTTIEVEPEAVCYKDDEIRIVQFY